MSLDEANTNPGYRLGRLFAVLEKIQEEANPGINATIRDRFYGTASSPRLSSVYSVLFNPRKPSAPWKTLARTRKIEERS